ncbi:MAG TPA: hypothetical protein PL017_06185 [Tenuifilaceae bacterium]|nr:hypothetical protein [Tenuifilaceae bacterium]HPE19130.1 hypothetical protein [Tenuifilaceae bacterium]HPJ45669.1 hypothetical protein [Tenuifilaceae bacterium]HPQ35112.1 hypothetical protein [Tenuifilaceae bacterium]HRX68806.1 hypothetical protein [Tenuifilaceae bacterium]
MKKATTIFVVALLTIFAACNQTKKNEAPEKDVTKKGFVHLTSSQLAQLGVYIKDTAVMYYNEVENVGGLNIAIRGMKYYGNAATTEQTNLNFYPRYITTLDTIQRAMYRLEGEHPNDMVEAHKWSTFESLIPVVVQQKQDTTVFGETLVFWFTKTPELEKLMKRIESED